MKTSLPALRLKNVFICCKHAQIIWKNDCSLKPRIS
jgi:hypothetical protein